MQLSNCLRGQTFLLIKMYSKIKLFLAQRGGAEFRRLLLFEDQEGGGGVVGALLRRRKQDAAAALRGGCVQSRCKPSLSR